MIEIVKGDLTKCREYFIMQQVNCQGAMGKGVAKALCDIYPEIKTKYKAFCKGFDPEELLGQTQWFYLRDGRVMINCFAQLDYKKCYDEKGRVYTDYHAFRECMLAVKNLVKSGVVAAPMNIGCGLAGGDWSVIHGILTDIFNDGKVTIRLYQLNEE